jgi:hypothetical protein
VGQRIFGLALGYEDLVDHDDLRNDPVLGALPGRFKPDEAAPAPLAGKSTLNRLEHAPQLPLSCPRFLWTPYCPEKLEDDSVEGNGKTMIDAAGLVGSEGERGSSMLSITGQAAGAGPLAPGQRWSLARKHEVVLRLLRGEPVEAVSRQFGVPVWQLERWQARALAGLKTGLRERSEDPAERELAEAHRRIGELSREVELLRARIERPGPLARRRSR